MARPPPSDAPVCGVNGPYCTNEGTATCDVCRRPICGACAIFLPVRRTLVCDVCAITLGLEWEVARHRRVLARRAEEDERRAARRAARRAREEAGPVEPPHISTRRSVKAPRVTMPGKENA